MVNEKGMSSSADGTAGNAAGRGRTLWLDCQAGVAGDMLVAALIDAAEDLEAAERAVRTTLAALPVEGFSLEVGRVSKAGISCLDFNVVLDEAHENHDHDMAYLHGHEHACEGDHGHIHGRESGCGHDHCNDHHHEGHHHLAGHAHDHAHHHDHAGDGAHDHAHRNLADILAIIEAAPLTPGAAAFARRAFGILAEAEAEAHGLPVEQVHFHEVGAVDSIADIVAAAVLVDLLGIERAIVPVLVEGRGTVRCQHGVMPVPVPATVGVCRAHGLPLAPCEVEGELVTPTGAALVAALSPEFVLPERYVVASVGLGAGKRAYERPSILRAMLIEPLSGPTPTFHRGCRGAAGEDAPAKPLPSSRPAPLSSETQPPTAVCKLECDLDDMTPEQMAYAAERLSEAGAREVHWVPIVAKKGRPAYELQVLCEAQEAAAIEAVVFRETSTLGIRRCIMDRTVLPRRLDVRDTAFGPISVKIAVLPDGTERATPEYEDCAAAARAAGVPLTAVMDAVRASL